MQIFDAHFHVIDYDYPVTENQGYFPPEFTIKDYQQQINELGITGGAIVSGSFQGFDQDYLINALNQLNDNFVGITQLPVTTPDQQIKELNEKGIKGIRFNVKRGGSEDLKHLRDFSERVYELVGWHTEIYIESNKLKDIKETIKQLPKVSIDHLGLTKAGFSDLKELVSHGVYVKATGFGRIEVDPVKTIKELMAINPNLIMFGTDLPSTRAKRPFDKEDIELVQNNFSKGEQEKIFFKNANEFYNIT